MVWLLDKARLSIGLWRCSDFGVDGERRGLVCGDTLFFRGMRTIRRLGMKLRRSRALQRDARSNIVMGSASDSVQ